MTNSSLKPVVDALNHWNSAVCSAASAINTEYLSFLDKRARADIKFGQEIAGCKSPVDAWSVVLNFWSAAADDYRKQTQRVVNHWAEMAGAGLTTVSTCTSEFASTEQEQPRLAA